MSRPRVVISRAAAERYPEHWFWGHPLFAELLGNETFTGMAALAATRRRLSPDDISLLNDLSVLITLADPQIWPLKITRIVASYGGFVSAVAAGNLCLEGGYVGPWNCGDAARTIAAIRERIGEAMDDEPARRALIEAHFAGEERVRGFGVPLRKIDERLTGLRQTIVRLGRAERPHWRTMEAISAVVRATRGLEPNFGMGVAAALLDMGCTPTECAVLAWWLQLSAFVANAVEGVEQGLELFRRFPDEWVDYRGPAPRESPRAKAAREGSR